MTVERKDCQARYNRIKQLLAAICDEIAAIEADYLKSNSSQLPGALSTLWDLKTRYTIEKVHMEAEFRTILKGIDD